MRLGELIAGLDIAHLNAGEFHAHARAGAELKAQPMDLRICDLTEDSRTSQPGSLFIARKGEKIDGKAFVAQAVDGGAVAVLVDDPAFVLPVCHHDHGPVVLLHAPDIALTTARLAERFYGEPTRKLTLIGVTGTNGKTTTTFLVHQMLNALGIRCGLIGTVVIDDGVEVAPSQLTTPPALELSRTLARMLEAGCEAAVMEVSSHALHQRRVGALRFAAGVFTNLTHDHLDYHGTMERYADAKAMLFEMLGPEGVAVVNVEDPAHQRMLRDCKARVVRTRALVDGSPDEAVDAPGTYTARVLEAGTGSTLVEFAGPGAHTPCRLPLVGSFNVVNALQAVAVVHAVYGGTGEDELSLAIVSGALESAAPPPGRLEPVTTPEASPAVLVDYAHTDDALRTVLTVVRGAMGQGAGRLWCVFGCGGDRDATKRPKMGRVAGELADVAIITSDNPRTENPLSIIEQVRAGVGTSARAKVEIEPDREKAIRRAITGAGPGDVVVIAGKGHEDYQILPDPARPGKTITRHFDDREEARKVLTERGVPVRLAVGSRASKAEASGG